MFKFFRTLIVIISVLGLTHPPLVKAEILSESRIVISEVQTESEVSAYDDFIELSNRSEDDVDVTGWEIQTKATSATSDWITRIVLDGTIYSGGSIILSYSSDSHPYLDDIASGHFLAGLSTTGGHVRILDTNLDIEEDKLGWGTAMDSELLPALKPFAPYSLSRKNVEGLYIDTNDNLADFELGVPTPRADNFAPEEDPPPETNPEEPPADEEPPVDDTEGPSAEEPPADEIPAEAPEEVMTPALIPLRINELFPDPVSPETDAQDEWVEIYNPNDTEINLENYKLQTGNSFSYSFTFAEITISAGGYISVSSGESSLVLSNSGGAARLLDPLGNVVDALASYPNAEPGEGYAFDGLAWSWTTTPTRNAENIMTQMLIEPKIIKAAVKSVKKVTTVKKLQLPKRPPRQ